MSAAQSGDTIMIAAGTFNIGDGAPPGQGTFGSVGSGHLPDNVTFVGAGEGQTIIIGNPRIASDTADFGAGVANGLTLKNMTLQYSGGNQYIMQWDAGNGGHNLTLDHVTLTGTSDGNAGSGNLSAVAGADGLTLNNVTYNVTTAAGGATTFIFGSGNDITVTGGHYIQCRRNDRPQYLRQLAHDRQRGRIHRRQPFPAERQRGRGSTLQRRRQHVRRRRLPAAEPVVPCRRGRQHLHDRRVGPGHPHQQQQFRAQLRSVRYHRDGQYVHRGRVPRRLPRLRSRSRPATSPCR